MPEDTLNYTGAFIFDSQIDPEQRTLLQTKKQQSNESLPLCSSTQWIWK